MTDYRWQIQHNRAMEHPRRGFEAALVKLVRGLAEYQATYEAKYDGQIGTDAVLGEAWTSIAGGVLALLNGEAGRLDCGTLDHGIREMARQAGVTEEL